MSVTIVSETGPFESWAIIEQLGHKRLAGYVREVEVAGFGMLRIDIPATAQREAITQYIGPSTIYAMTPTTEEMARKVAEWSDARPVTYWEQRQLAAPSESDAGDLADIPFDDGGDLLADPDDFEAQDQHELREGRG